jgi:hypothetical protein
MPAGATNVMDIAAGQVHSLALRADGKVLAWGDNLYGQTSVPAGLSDVVAVAAGGRHSLALKSDGTVTAWGYNVYNQTNVPASATNVVAIAAGDLHSVALKADGTLVSWGNLASPPPAFNVIGIAAGNGFSLALRDDSAIVPWGGYPATPFGLSNVVAIASGFNHALLIGPNRPPTAANSSTDGLANHDLVVVPSASDPNGDALSIRIITLPAQGALYQYANGARGARITSPNTALADPSARAIFAPAVNASGIAYASFSFVAGDGEFETSPPSWVNINIAGPVAPSFGTPVMDATNGFQLSFTGDSNTVYCVWGSTNLVDWQVLGSGMQTGPGTFLFADPAATNTTQRFYRLSTGCGGLGP